MAGPLAGSCVLVTRPMGQEKYLVQQLEMLGAAALHWPAIAILPPADFAALDAAIARLADVDWLVFSSVNGVTSFFQRCTQIPEHTHIAAIGTATAAAIERYGARAALVPADARAEGLVEALQPYVTGKTVLLIKADRGRVLLAQELAKTAQVEAVVAYRQVDCPPDPDIFAVIRVGDIDAVLVSSSNIARNFIAHLDSPSRQQVISSRMSLIVISPVTAESVLQLGLPVAAIATESTDDGLLAALLKANRARHSNPNKAV